MEEDLGTGRVDLPCRCGDDGGDGDRAHALELKDGRDDEAPKALELKWLTVKRAAEYLGVSRDFIRELMNDGGLNIYKVRRLLFLDREDVDEYMERRKIYDAHRGEDEIHG